MVTEAQYGSDENKVLSAYTKMIEWILSNTDNNVMLIPHVMKNLDLKVLRLLYSKFTDNKRVFLIENEELNAKQLKYLISNCIFYIGARTHSTIAAYSSCVPTLVLGYSVKSIGIAKDLFGTSDGYVVPVKNLSSDEVLVKALSRLYENKEQIKEKLENETMPDYIEKTWSAGEMFSSLIKKN